MVKFGDLIEPRSPAEMEQGLTQFTQMTGVNLKTELLAALGDTWTVYNSPGDGGLIFTGLTVTGTIRDRAKLVDANEKLVKAARASTGRLARRKIRSKCREACRAERSFPKRIPWTEDFLLELRRRTIAL